MRLYLSSQNLGGHVEKLFEMLGTGRRLAFIDNAKDHQPKQQRKGHVEEKKKEYEALGFEFKEIDLREYFGKKDKLLREISDFHFIFASGGNEFILRRAFAQSGLDSILKELLVRDKVVYGGSSAGSMIAGPDLEGPDWSEEDSPDIVPEGYDPDPIYQALNLVDFYFIPHRGSPLHGESPQRLAAYYESKNLPYYMLKDGQVLIVDGDKVEVLK